MTKTRAMAIAAISFALLPNMSRAEAQLLQVEVLPQQNGRTAPLYLDQESQKKHSSQEPVALSQVWKNLHQELDSDFFREILRHLNQDDFLRRLQDEDFSNTSLPLLSSSFLEQKGVERVFRANGNLMADLSGLEKFIQQQETERQLALIIQWRTLILDRAMDHFSTEGSKPKWWSGSAMLRVGYDSNLNRIPESSSAPSQHDGRSDIQRLAMLNFQIKPPLRQKTIEMNAGLTIFGLQHQDDQQNDLWGVSLQPRLSTKMNNDFVDRFSLSLPMGILDFPNQKNATHRLLNHGLRVTVDMQPLSLNFEDWGDIRWQWSMANIEKKASTHNDQKLDRRSTQLGLSWSMSLPKAWSLTSSHHYDLQKGEQSYLSRKQWFHSFTLRHPLPKKWITQTQGSIGFQLDQKLYPEYFGGTQKEFQQQWKLSLSKRFSTFTASLDLIDGQKTQTLDPDFLSAIHQNISYQKAQCRFQYGF